MLKIKNTLTGKHESLNKTEIIDWYMCGPTVYDESHLGHARNYISNDIMIRIMKYLGYNVFLAMNITDIDDKIIKKSLDVYNTPNNFGLIAKQYEESFMNDMIALNVNMPDVILRVSEYMREIILFIQKLIDIEMAYQSNGSVYFDYDKFIKTNPGFVSMCNHIEENDIIDPTYINDKKNYKDFALWKKSKENDVQFSSPFGEGRPGWHIECSAMIQSVFGDTLDIHSGGIDLKFPHHDNERKQSIAFNNSERHKRFCDDLSDPNWCRHFVHIGHLHIDGQKMSKSLKNFTTIKSALHNYSSNDIRLFCLMHHYSYDVEFSSEHMDQIKIQSEEITKYVNRTELFVKNNKHKLNYAKPSQENVDLIRTIKTKEINIINYLQNDFSTEHAMNEIYKLIECCNINNTNYQVSLLIFNIVYNTMSMLGFIFDKKNHNEFTLINMIGDIRSELRTFAQENKINKLYKITDDIRSKLNTELNIIIDDTN